MTEQSKQAETTDNGVSKPENSFLDGRESEARMLEHSLGEVDQELDFVPPEEAIISEGEPSSLEPQAAPQMSNDDAAGAAFMLLSTYESTMRALVGKGFTLPDDMKQEAIEKYTPLIVKYGPSALGVLGQYQDEFVAGVFTISLVRESFSQMKQIKQEKKASEQPQKTPETPSDAVSKDAA